jgi:hypothetical protein
LIRDHMEETARADVDPDLLAIQPISAIVILEIVYFCHLS